MPQLDPESFASILALIGIVIVVAALLSGIVDRTRLPQVAIFLALGALLGPGALGLVHFTLESPTLRLIATLGLVMVLFTDAINLTIREVRRHAKLAAVVLGPGTLVVAGLTGLAAWLLLDLPFVLAAMLGAALASTDPVLLRGLLRQRGLPSTTRQALTLESGMNDVVLLPVVLIAIAFSGHDKPDGAAGWGMFAANLFVIGPLAGIAIGWGAVRLLEIVRGRYGVRRDYESLYALGVAFTAFAAAEMAGASGFLAAFVAGLTIAVLDVELCDCFIDYGEATAEMALLFTFVALGAGLIWTGLDMIDGPAMWLFIAAALLLRPLVLLVTLMPMRVPREDLLLILWFGPRGLSSLLLILLPVFAGVPGADRLFSIACLVTLASVLLHGGSILFWRGGRAARTADAATAHAAALEGQRVVRRPEPSVSPDEVTLPADPERISLAEVARLQAAGVPVYVLDARTERSLAESDLQAVGALRLPPDQAADVALRLGLPRDAWLALFCT